MNFSFKPYLIVNFCVPVLFCSVYCSASQVRFFFIEIMVPYLNFLLFQNLILLSMLLYSLKIFFHEGGFFFLLKVIGSSSKDMLRFVPNRTFVHYLTNLVFCMQSFVPQILCYAVKIFLRC